MNVRDRIRALRAQMSRISDRYTRDAIKTTVEALEALEHWMVETDRRLRHMEETDPDREEDNARRR